MFRRFPIAFALLMGLSLIAHADDEAALLAAIRANPAEDTPRLVYADWLDEHGDSARAEFIRLQVKAARLNEGTRERREVEGKANGILTAHEAGWLPKDFRKQFGKDSTMQVRWERGFPAELVLPRVDPPLAKAIDWFHPPNGLPMLSQITARSSAPAAAPLSDLVALSHHPLFRYIPSINITDLDVSRLNLLAALAFAENLRRLELNARDSEALQHIGISPHAPRLRSLVFRGSGNMHSLTLEEIAGGSAFPNLEELDLRGVQHTHSLAYLATHLRLPRLKRLVLDPDVSEIGEVVEFVKTPAFQRLQSFSYRGSPYAAAALYPALAKVEHALIELDIYPYSFSPLQWREIAAQKTVENAMARHREEQKCATLALLLSEI